MKHLLVLTYFIGLSLYAQDAIYDPLKSKGHLYEYANFFDADNLDLTLDEVLKDSLFYNNVLESENHSVGFTSNNYWVRFNLTNSTKQTTTYYLETARL